jgi:hypothetical protein
MQEHEQYYCSMPRIIAILCEDDPDAAYIAVELDSPEEPEVLFMKGPGFEKRMGPFPLPYAEATFSRWNYRRVKNPPQVALNDAQALLSAMRGLKPDRCGGAEWVFGREERA